MEEKARQAFELRNTYRTQARQLMAGEEMRRKLENEHPNPIWEEKIADKKVIKSNKNVNKKLGME